MKKYPNISNQDSVHYLSSQAVIQVLRGYRGNTAVTPVITSVTGKNCGNTAVMEVYSDASLHNTNGKHKALMKTTSSVASSPLPVQQSRMMNWTATWRALSPLLTSCSVLLA